MKFIIRWCWIGACAATAHSLMAAQPGEPGGPGEYRDFKVLKTYSASDGEYSFHAFVIEWEGQEVIAMDAGAVIKAHTDDAINVLVSRGSRGNILFLARPEKKAPLEPGQAAYTPGNNRPLGVRLKVGKVYAFHDDLSAFRAYEVEWSGQQVVVSDGGLNTAYEVGDMLTVMVSKRPSLDPGAFHDLLDFNIMPERGPARARSKR